MSRAPAMAALPLSLPLLLVAAAGHLSVAQTTDAPAGNDTGIGQRCAKGLILPVWQPQENLSTGDVFARALVYFLLLMYFFIGVSIVADRFMASIEVITSKEKEVTVKRPNGETQIIVVRVWNETVANLTLMALGSSAPEILLSIIEIYAKNFEAGALGPGTIVGSAAFNLFVIVAICVYVIPDGEVRKIKHLRVFFVTCAWSLFAYVWLYLILAVISAGVVEIWEALLTLCFFPATVATAYIADRRMLFYKYMSKEYRLNKRGIIVEHEGREMEKNFSTGGELKRLDEEHVDEAVKEFEENRREYIGILRELRKKHPNMGMEQLEMMAREEVLNKGPKSRAFYRIQATRKLTGSGGSLTKHVLPAEKRDGAADMEDVTADDNHVIKVFFDPGHYTVMESVGDFTVTVKREGGDLGQCLLVDYRTEDGSASAGGDYVAASGTLFFGHGDSRQTFSVSVIDDDLFEEDEHFYVKLANLRLAEPNGAPLKAQGNGSTRRRLSQPELKLAAPFVATVMILDDDHGGIFNVGEKDVEIVESVGTYDLKVVRWSGARGRVAVPFTTIEGTAKPNKDYEHCEGEMIFDNNETERFITIPIIEEDSYEKDVLFYVELKEPRYLSVDGESGSTLDFKNKNLNDLSEEEKIALLGKPKLGETKRAQIRIKESKEFKNTVDKLVQRANASLAVGTTSWKEQFIQALTVSPANGDDDDGEGDDEASEDEKHPSCADYLMHFITVFWKVLFAFIPPTDRLGGWACFCASVTMVGVLTAFIGDISSHFGCTVGLEDAVTAISIVALGTSVPDTFASKVAAVQDRYADASIGNVTGSNGVNVFLGIGIAWSMATLYHYFTNSVFTVDPGNLAFSVTLFICEAVAAIGLMMLRRHKSIGGELGGPRRAKILSALFLFMLWVLYLMMSTLDVYGVLPTH